MSGVAVWPEQRDADVLPVDLHADSPDGAGIVGIARPRLSWRLAARRTGVVQLACQVQTAADAAFTAGVVTGPVCAEAMPFTHSWPDPLASRAVRWARVRIATDRGASAWSDGIRVEAALLSAADWTARPISPVGNAGLIDPAPVPLLRRRFRLAAGFERARLYITALGVHDTWINGEPVSDARLDPGWTAYGDRLLYAAYDVGKLLRPGENVIAAAVGDGWWRGWLTWLRRRAIYGHTTALLAQLEIVHGDGSRTRIDTDADWRGGDGAIRMADLYDGSTIDARREPHGWREPSFDDRDWRPVTALPLPHGLQMRPMPPARIVERRQLALEPNATGWSVDTGQNLSGHLRLEVRGHEGATVTVRHAEVLDATGALHTVPLRHARATDRYVLAGKAPCRLKPAFTFHGFRHAEITADPGVECLAAEACTVSSDLPRIGWFRCSDGRVNRLYENARWSQIGNFLSLPTDCPQRDERLGWTGDIQVFAQSACHNADVRTFLANWLADLRAEQRDDGNVPSVVPNVIADHEFGYGGVGWGDAATLVPWALYEAYGDAIILSRQFESMRAWVDYGLSRCGADGTWSQDFHFGDWLDPGAPSDQPEKGTTDSFFVATAYLSRSCAILAAAANVLGRSDVAERYATRARRIADAAWSRWRDHAVTTQTGCALSIAFDIAPAPLRGTIGATLAALVERNGGRIATGFLGTPLVLPALTATGHSDAAYRLLLNPEAPGWLHQLAQGATTMWERWDAIKGDGSLHGGEMTTEGSALMVSFNHYAYGALVAWLYRSAAGIAPDPAAPGYRRIRFAPQPGGELRYAAASQRTPFGRAAIHWTRPDRSTLRVAMTVPPGADATFSPPDGWSVLTDAGTTSSADLLLPSGRHRIALRHGG